MKENIRMVNSLTKIMLVGVFLIFQSTINAQSGVWTWMHGDSIPNQSGDYGVKTVTAPANLPPARYQTAHWQDKDGNFWIYGGIDVFLDTYGDLWKFNPQINQWTWMNGAQGTNTPAVWGVKGVSSPLNMPPSSGYGSLRWYDGEDALYLYSGYVGPGMYNTNIWKYDLSTSEWVWLWGPGPITSEPNYGTKGIASSNNSPGFRAETEACWFKNDTLWFFGGSCNVEPGVNKSCSDIWAFDLSSNEWIWMHGPMGSHLLGVPGNLGEHDPENYPGSRMVHSDWVTDSNYYCYSGMDNLSGMNRTDLWEYKMKEKTWAWLDGTIFMTDPIWDEYCDENLQDNPSSVIEQSSANNKMECSDILWLFGGLQSKGIPNYKNDLWAYIVQKKSWTLIWGIPDSSVAANYGELKIPNVNNSIPNRMGASLWVDSNNDLWVFGGARSGFNDKLNDIWHFQVDYECLGLDSSACCILTVDIRLGNVSSDSIDNGTITINILDGEGDIEYSIDGGITWTDDNFFQGLPAGDYHIIARDESGCIYEGIVTILDFSTSTFGLKNDLKVEVFPNPASDMLYYAIGSGDVERVQIYSMNGVEQECRKADRRVEVKDLPTGMYLLRIVSEGKSGLVKFEKL